MQEDEVKRIIKTPADACCPSRFREGQTVKAIYDAEDKEYNRYSQHTAAEEAKGQARAIEKMLMS